MAVTCDDVLKIAALANLHFAEEEIDAFTHQFQRILEYIAQLSEVEVSGVEPTSHVSLAQDFDKYQFREDEVQGSLPVEESLANAPEPGHGHFKVPKVI